MMHSFDFSIDDMHSVRFLR